MGAIVKLLVASFALITVSVFADPDMLQDICVADLTSGTQVNGYPCKASTKVKPEDFFSSLLAKPGATDNSTGSIVTPANVQNLPGLNTLGISLARTDFAPGGVNPPHIHPRATEVAYVLEGDLDVGFITTENKLISKSIKKGDVFVFPKGLVHFQKNSGKAAAVLLSALGSQLPGAQYLGVTMFHATPDVPDDVLAKAFRVDDKGVQKIKSKFCNRE